MNKELENKDVSLFKSHKKYVQQLCKTEINRKNKSLIQTKKKEEIADNTINSNMQNYNPDLIEYHTKLTPSPPKN